jgi:transglutaminase-like putative cysteine protease
MSTRASEALDRGSTPWLFAAALATTLPHAEHQPYWLTGFAAGLFGWGAWLWWRNARLPGRWPLLLLVALACAGILLEYRTLFGRDAGVAMLVVFMALKLLELRSRRDATAVVMLAYFLLLTHYFFSQSIFTGLWLLAAMTLVTASLVRLHGGPASQPVATLRYAGLLTVQAVPFMLVLFVLFPRVNGPLWGLPQDAHGGRSGLSDEMVPGNIANLALSSEIAFRARFDGPVPPRDKLYWRGPVLEAYDGILWRPVRAAGRAPRIEAESPQIAYEMTLEPHQRRWLLALDAPGPLPANSSLSGTLTATAREPVIQRQRLTLSAVLAFRYNVDEDPAVLRRNLALPPDTNPRTRELAESWQRADPASETVVRRALELFAKESFFYTLQPPLLGPQPIDDFLFSTRRGFCEHYSAAFVVLMRAAGVPARVVTGYQGGETNPVDGFVVVRQSDAHAWAEVWMAGRGWVRIDPTAAVSPARVEAGIATAMGAGEPVPALIQLRGDWIRTLRFRWEAIENAWNQHILGYNPERQRQLLARLGLPDADWRKLAAILGVICGGLLLSVTAWTLYQRPHPDQAYRLWQKALRRLARRQVHCAPCETPLALVRRLEREKPLLAPDVAEVADAYLLARYGNRPDHLHRLRAAVARLP